ncbi:hypothetical protein MuYL_4278 [Mucilaginibacter xinganensis]|uniref:Uncharacterized protein n=1 Tax=Mucilaginibacter xinganensis TaxID=1234841 RepID=A0A223P203_9SPHI|nr:hypothetical protein MuYL_4278 [Mucilaginibacter xinganensis]
MYNWPEHLLTAVNKSNRQTLKEGVLYNQDTFLFEFQFLPVTIASITNNATKKICR